MFSIRVDVGQCVQVTKSYGAVPAVTSSPQRHWSDGSTWCSTSSHQSSFIDSWSWQLWPGVHWLSVLLSTTADCQLSWEHQVSSTLLPLLTCSYIHNISKYRSYSPYPFIYTEPTRSTTMFSLWLCTNSSTCAPRVYHCSMVRQRYFIISSLEELFDAVNAQNVLGFIWDIWLYCLI